MIEQNWQLKESLWKSPEASALGEVFKKEGVKAVLFDLDDTLMRTYFTEGRLIYMRALEILSGRQIDQKQFMSEWYDRFNFFRSAYGVNPVIHEWISRETAVKYGCDFDHPLLFDSFNQMWEKIYSVVPENIPGAFEVVQTIKAAGADTAIGTHAQYDWTWLKLANWRGEFKKVHCIDVHGPKDAPSWLELMNIMGVSPEEVAVVGDSVESDMVPNAMLGVKHLFRLSASWGKAKDLPAGVHEIEDLREIVTIFLNGSY